MSLFGCFADSVSSIYLSLCYVATVELFMFSLYSIITPLIYIYSFCQLLIVTIVHLMKEAKWLDCHRLCCGACDT